MQALSGIAIRSIAAAVPTRVERTCDYTYLEEQERERFRKATGIGERRVVRDGQCASDLCATAAHAVMEKLGWDPSSIGALVMVTQTGDQPVPATAVVLQHKLGLPQACVAFDVNLGCSGYPNGLAIVGSLMRSLGIARGLLLIGDVSSRLCAESDKSAWPLFGDAGSATALELDAQAPPMHVDLMSDGSGKDAIVIPGGGLASRRPPGDGPMQPEIGPGGIERRPDQLILRGADIFSFAISRVPPGIQRTLEASGRDSASVDYLLLHQANRMINDTIARKCGFESARVPTSLERYGNTSSASIPVTLCTNAALFAEPTTVVACGFGVGLSWATAVLELPAGVAIDCVESDAVH